jgi:solute carrier family 25 protein 33/36
VWHDGSGLVTITLTSPVWVVKTRLQLQVGNGKGQTTSAAAAQASSSAAQAAGVRQYRSAWHCVTSMMKHEGPRSFFAGMSASYVGISESSIQFMLYEKFKSLIKQRRVRQREEAWQIELERRRHAHAQRHGAHTAFDLDDDPELVQLRELARATASASIGAWETLAISSSAKLIASVLTYPHEVARTRLREERARELYGGFVNCVRVVWRNEGLAGLYGGLTPHLLRVVPNAAIMFLTYEAVLSLFDPSSSPSTSSSSAATR